MQQQFLHELKAIFEEETWIELDGQDAFIEY